MLIDSHCHLDFPEFADDFADVLTRAKTAGVGTMVTICTSLGKFPQVLATARRSPDLYCSVGVHPHTADAELVSVDDLLPLTHDPKVVAIGETGLDYFYNKGDHSRQQQNFRAHIAVARTTGLPLVVHTRDADTDTVAILEEEYTKGAFPGLIHCFTASQELAERVLALGFYISISGIVTFKNAEPLRQTLKTVPLDRILVETDAPYLAPIPHRGKRNEPSFVAHTAEAVGAIKGVSIAEITRATTDNFHRLFRKVPHA